MGEAMQFKFTRRGLLATAGAAALLPGLPHALMAASGVPPTSLSADAALERLMEGNSRYAANLHLHGPAADREALATGQAPFAVVLACADSRVAPELVFDQGPGGLFTIRLAGNFVTDYGLASIEYAVEYLQVPLVMVMGHSGCGAVSAAVDAVESDARFPGELDKLVGRITPVVRDLNGQQDEGANGEKLLDQAIRENARRNARLLESEGAILPQRVREGRLRVVAALHDLAGGHVYLV
ncbi:carbonic anhydrase [Aquibaculum arenosum]|uniref:Carbonic anhydrase n=1 Tax=Aquibaculum arenosum TaxID=3032591 RepID=A0ABT5YPL4_9PROT|nr:carbonic anhydrase [Fodinicurvata sp. CAU 1616]MDF2096893.1 carbonic anhydrase [Fodinicurvata sp. CAU 1616]